MKKLLNLLSIMILTTSLSSDVISCSTKSNDARIDSPKLSDKIGEQIIQSIVDYSEVSGMSVADIWKNNSTEINTLVYNLLQENVAKDFYIKVMSARANNLGSTPPVDLTTLSKSFDNYVDDLTMNDLYQTYTKDYENGTYFENQIFSTGYSPDVQSLDWYNSGSSNRFFVDSDNNAANWNDNFNWNDTNDDNGKVAYDENVKEGIPQISNFKHWNDMQNSSSNNVSNIKKQLNTRFRTYIDNNLKLSMYGNTIVNSYLQSGSYLYKNDKPLIREYSPLFNNWQSWNNNEWYSNMKMVWEVRLTKNTKNLINDSNYNSWITNLNKAETLSDFENCFTSGTNNINADSYGINYGGANQLGRDSIFGQKGYEGLYGITPNSDNTQSGTIFTANSSNTDITSYTTPLTTNSITYKPGVIRNSDLIIPNQGQAPYFKDSNGDIVISFVLPIYLLDLIQGAEVNPNISSVNDPKHGISYIPFNETGDTVKNPISFYNDNYSGSDDKDNNLQSQWANMNPNQGIDNRDSYDVENLKINNGINDSQNLFNLIESSISTNGLSTSGTDTGIALNADQALYTWAFNGDSDNIYTNDLYTKIGKYIESNN